MKKALLFLCLFVMGVSLFAQDTTNFYTIKAEWDHYWDSIIEVRGIDSMDGTGYNPYKRLSNYWEEMLYPHGDYTIYNQGKSNHLQSFVDFGTSTSETLNWRLIGPDRMPERNYVANTGNTSDGIRGIGQIHYIAFDPNDQTFNKMFACSPAGGLWKSIDGGESWTNAGTDLDLDFSGVSSVAIDPNNSDNNWFITTGCAEGMPGHLWWQNAIGVWRTMNGGDDWEYIGLNSFGDNKIEQMRKIIIVPSTPGSAHLFVVTNVGVFECKDALIPEPVWIKLCDGNYYDIEIHPNSSIKKLYVSGTTNTTIKVINYQNYPASCSPLPNLGFLPDPTENEQYRRITIANSPAAENYLFIVVSYNLLWYSYPTGSWNSKLYKYNLMTDTYVDKGALPTQYSATVCNAGINVERGMGWAISPVLYDGELWMVHGNTAPIRATKNLLDNNPCDWFLISEDSYTNLDIHVDQHYMTIIDDPEDITLWVGNDGGVYRTYLRDRRPDGLEYEWVEMNDGLAVATIYNIATSRSNLNTLLSGQHDNGSLVYHLNIDGEWSESHVGGGDGMKPDMNNDDYLSMYVSAQYAIMRYSDDAGFTFNSFPSAGGIPNWNSYLTLNPGNQNEIYVCGCDINRTDPDWDDDKWGLKKYVNGSWYRWESFETQISIVNSNTIYADPSTWKLEISETDPDIIYTIWRGGQSEDPKIGLRVFKSETGGGVGINDWYDLGEPGYNWGWMSDIAIDFFNPDIFYLAKGNKIFKCNSADPAIPVWTEYISFPSGQSYKVNSICFVNGSPNFAMYAGTNYGLFYIYEENGVPTYEDVNGNLPHADVRDIEINYAKKTIAVGTFGRGVWEADLPCDYIPVAESITGTVNYNTEQFKYSDIIIESGGILNITSTLHMGENRSIIVKRGGILIVDGGAITNACAGMWKGIQVWGNPKQAHTFPSQGKIMMRNEALIEMAQYGIRTTRFITDESDGELIDLNYSGGIVNIVNSRFLNNFRSVSFYKYPDNGYSYQSSNFINTSEFEIDINYPADEGENIFVYLSEINPVRFTGNDFANNSNYYHYGTGIKAFNATFFVEGTCTGGNPCTTWENGDFFNLDFGIYSSAGSSVPYTDVRHTTFNDNYHGIYCDALSNARITNNEFFFYDNIPLDSWGIYLDYSTGYMVEENEFINVSESMYYGIGIIINYSGEPKNEVYNNYFENLLVGTQAQNTNRNSDPDFGLKIKCNDYYLNRQDIYVTAEVGCPMPGISKYQGAPGATNLQAGNTFSWNYNMFLEFSDYDNLVGSDIYYFHHDPDQNPGEYHIVPHYYTPAPTINLVKQPTIYDKEESCPSNITSGGGSSGGEIRGEMIIYENQADSIQDILSALVDGGNTILLEQQVLESMPPETYDLYMSLMGKSPYLSDSVLIAALEKEDVLPNVLIKDILVANPQAAKSAEVLEKVDQKSQPFTDEMLAEILLGKYLTAAKEKLEAQSGMYKHKRAMVLNSLKRKFLSDTLDPNNLDSLNLLLEQETGIHEKYELIFAKFNNNQWVEAINTFNGIPTQFNLSIQQQELYNDLEDYFGVLVELYQADTGFYGLSQIQNTTLLDLAESQYNRAGAYARNILNFLGENNYTPPVLFPENNQKSTTASFSEKPQVKPYAKVKVYPNPAKEYIVVEFQTGNLNGAIVDLYDMQGRLFKSVQLPEKKQQHVVGILDMPNGIYLIRVNFANTILGVEKITISR